MVWDMGFSAIPWYGMGSSFSNHTIHGMIWVFGGLSHGMVYARDCPMGWYIYGISHVFVTDKIR